MNPVVLDIKDINSILTFTIENINVSYANAIRRVILTDIETVVFRTFPPDKNDATIYINTSRLNNEILKQRLSCIPIHINDLEMPIDDYIVEINVKNDTDTILYVTTADFKIRNTKTDKYLNEEIVQQIFPPDNITKQYIDFCRLRPKIGENIEGEHLKMTCLFSIDTAKTNGSYNVVSSCSYRNTLDHTAIEVESRVKEEELKQKYEEDSDVKYHLKDWLNLNAKRIFIENSFDFTIETLGVFDNLTIVKAAINNIISRLKKIIEIYSSKNGLITKSVSTIPNSFDITLETEDFTIGKILEYTLFDTYYNGNKTLTYCGFRKPHPHINNSIIRLAYHNDTEKSTVVEYINNAATIAIDIYEKLLTQLGDITPP
jgi:DNA-directed RNA polymerases I and III subunit RPAC1